MDGRVIVWAHGRDSALSCTFLEEAGFECVSCSTLADVELKIAEGAALLVVAGELLSAESITGLRAFLDRQPPWSDLPLIVVAGSELAGPVPRAFEELGSVSILHRPLSLDTFITTVRTALRARRRQYQVRDLLRQREQSERRKDEFLAMLAHELRNPLAPIRTGLELLELEPPEEVVQSTRAMIARQLTHLTRLVDDLLDVSRITRGKVVLQKRLLVVEDTLRQIAEGFEPQCLEKGITFRLDLPGETLHISADPTRLEQMVGNLLSNALKFTPRGGFITLAAEAQEDSIAISVTDSGVGIPADQVDQVFDLFSQTERSLDRSLGGLGIGLTVVRALAVLHGGTARISSPGENNGVHAVIRLPRAASEAPAGNEPATDSNPESPLPCRVLIIEDNDDARETLAAYLRLRGCHVEVAGDGHAGLEAAVRSVPEVVICDIGLPGMNGYRIVSTLKLQPQFQRTVFIAVTGYGDIPDRQRSKASGFHAHLTKPASPKDIARLIAAHLSNPARSETAGNG